ncbi:MAG: HAMP domain-containing histidine kinase [Ruminiclostridium sp.]|nr:HAMP domain-containing histidine kinase [Ruminiclostridium sp.]
MPVARQENRTKVRQSLQTRLAIGYAAIIAALLILLNTYPLITTQNLMFRSQQTALYNQAALVINSLTTADGLTPETVEQAIAPLEDLEVRRMLVTDEAGLVLYDTGEPSGVGKYALTREVVSALRGNDAFASEYREGVFSSRAASPVMTRNTVVGAVCLYEDDSSQGVLLGELQHNLRLVSLVVCLAVLILFAGFSRALARRVNHLLSGIRRVREGEYTHRISLEGQDELGQLADEFNQLTGRIQTTEEARRRFVSDAAHELKTPLASIRLLTDSILQDENIDRDTALEFVGDIGDATDRLIRISQELLTLNRLDEGRTAVREPVEVNGEVEKICRLLAPLAEEAQVTLETDLGADCVVVCSREDVDQILRNLMENAIKYNLPRGSVTVTTARTEDRIRLTVADTGVGIPREEMDRIFERFYRVDKARSRAAGGTGLGLSIVRDSVRHYGGQISVAPREEQGTVFTVELPAWKEENP